MSGVFVLCFLCGVLVGWIACAIVAERFMAARFREAGLGERWDGNP